MDRAGVELGGGVGRGGIDDGGGGTDGGATATINITLATANAQAWTAFANGKLIGTGSELGHHGGTATITFPIPSASLQPGAPDRLDGASIPARAATTLLVLMSTSLGIDNGGIVDSGFCCCF